MSENKKTETAIERLRSIRWGDHIEKTELLSGILELAKRMDEMEKSSRHIWNRP